MTDEEIYQYDDLTRCEKCSITNITGRKLDPLTVYTCYYLCDINNDCQCSCHNKIKEVLDIE